MIQHRSPRPVKKFGCLCIIVNIIVKYLVNDSLTPALSEQCSGAHDAFYLYTGVHYRLYGLVVGEVW